MAVVVVVEDGTVVTDANSYVSVAEATDYLAANIHVGADWTSLSADDKAALVVWATRYLDNRAVWFGTKTDNTSSLRWPRTGVRDVDNILIGANTIPNQLKMATIEMARYLIAEDRSIERGSDGLMRLKVDVIQLQFDQNYRLAVIPNELQVLIRGLGYFIGGRYGFGRIRRA